MNTVRNYFPYFLLAGILLNANGLFIDILEPDGALYATISKHIALSGDWMNLYGDGHDWLDKPHFSFWISALSFKVFGINAFAYKFPAFLSWLSSVCFTYKLCSKLYNPDAAKIACLVYVFSLHSVLNNFDVRAEPYLTAFIIAAIYLMHQANETGKWKFIVLAALASACAVMTKGIFALITVGSGFVLYWISSRQWKQFVNFRWWVMLLLILLFITPELYSLYSQFDLHPQKVVFGRSGVSGVKFFFWDSQFGRFFNTGPIKGHGDPSFFLHTTLWAFLPWSVILYIAAIYLLRKHDSTGQAKKRWIIYGSALVTFILFSLSRFQLPHYIVILFPQFSIITAAYLISIKREATFKRLTVLQAVLLILSALLLIALAFYSKLGNVVFAIGISAAVVVFTFVCFKDTGLNRLIAVSSAVSVTVFLFLFNFFYPKLLQYQAGMVAGKYLAKHNIAARAATLNASSYSFEFYAPGYVEYVNNVDEIDNFIGNDSAAVFYTADTTLASLEQKGRNFSVLKRASYFHISMLTGSFLNRATRESLLQKMALILVRRKG